jgi:hypothetical protein
MWEEQHHLSVLEDPGEYPLAWGFFEKPSVALSGVTFWKKFHHSGIFCPLKSLICFVAIPGNMSIRMTMTTLEGDALIV